jgi:hypothetical protein
MKDIELAGNLRIPYPFAFRFLDAVIKKVGYGTLFTNGRYKRYKELYLGAITAQMLTMYGGMAGQLYVVSPDDDPPDFFIKQHKLHDDDEDKTDEISYAFEVVDYTEHSPNIEAVIDDKLARNYPENYNIVVLFKHPTETTYDYAHLVEKYRDEKRWILIIMRTDRTASGILLNGDHWIVAAVSPPPVQQLIKPDKTDKPGYDQMLTISHRGRNQVVSSERVRIKLPD